MAKDINIKKDWHNLDLPAVFKLLKKSGQRPLMNPPPIPAIASNKYLLLAHTPSNQKSVPTLDHQSMKSFILQASLLNRK